MIKIQTFIGVLTSINPYIVAMFTFVLMNKDFNLGYLIAVQCKSKGAGSDRPIGNKQEHNPEGIRR